MSGRLPRVALVAVDTFTAVTAIGGGLALAAGLEGARFPTTWLEGTPFRSYVAPGVLLAGAVGGTAGVAAIASVRSPRAGGRASMVAGAVLASWIVGEILLLAKDDAVVSPTESLYLAIAGAMSALGWTVARGAHVSRL
jgi:hypothetical protein